MWSSGCRDQMVVWWWEAENVQRDCIRAANECIQMGVRGLPRHVGPSLAQ